MIKKVEGEMITRVIDHIVCWVNAQPTDIRNRHGNNKPLGLQNPMPDIQKLMATAYRADWWAQLREDGDDDNDADEVATWLELHSRSLEK